jgi:hypothetical protein
VKKLKPSDLTTREGMVLRYVCSYTEYANVEGRQKNVEPVMCVVGTPWSELPKNVVQARAVLSKLAKLKLIAKDGKGYKPLAAGHELERAAREPRIWLSKPS